MRGEYKDTPIGIIPDDWQVIKLNNLLELLTDFEANGSFSDTKHNVQVQEKDGFAWYVRATDLEKNTPLNEVKYVNESSYKYLRKSSLQGNELLITKRGEIGKVYYFTKPENLNATLAPNLYLLKLNSQVIPKFLYYYFISEKGNRTLKRIDASSALGALYKDDVKNLQVPLPSLAEQNKITLILSTVDDKIAAINEKIAQTQQLKNGLMQRLLTKGVGHTKFKDSPLGEIPESWKLIRFEETCKNISLKYSLLQGRCIDLEHIEQNTGRIIGYTEIKSSSSSKNHFKPNDILFGKLRPYLRKYWLAEFEGACTSELLILRATDGFDPKFLFFLVQQDRFIQNAIGNSFGTKMPRTNWKAIADYPIAVPPLSEQHKIAEILITENNKLAILQEKETLYIQLKTGLMQQLLTGKIRVKF